VRWTGRGGERCWAVAAPRQPNRRQVRAKALKAFKQDIRRLTHRTRGGPAVGGARRAAICHRLVRLLWLGGSDGRLQGTRLLDSATPARLPVEAMGATARPGTGTPWGGPRSCLEHGQVGPWAVAGTPQSGADLRVTRRVFRRAWGSSRVSAPASLTESAEPP
jgi:hypothetical protein